MTDVDALVAGVLAADRRSIAQAITLVESVRAADDAPAESLLEQLATASAERPPAHRVGISGVPGVGKSSLLETLGVRLVQRGHKVAVLAVDPSSSVSGGSILGDKTRMDRLSREANAFIRPTAGAGELGGVAARTREAMLVCEAAGFDVVFVETIGVGQSEATVRDLVDTFALLMLTGAGDDLQGIKRGVLELADLLVVTKADGDNEPRARAAAAELRTALHILHGQSSASLPAVCVCSARSGEGVDAVWDAITAHRTGLESEDAFATRRSAQDVVWFERRLDQAMRRRFLGAHGDALQAARDAVRAGTELAPAAARRLLGD